MREFTPICKQYPKTKPLAAKLIAAAAQQGASVEELQYASEIAVRAYKEAASAVACAELQREAETALNSI